MCSSAPDTMFQLVSLIAGVTPTHFMIEPDMCLIGRAPNCHIIVRHPLVSRHHARIERRDGSHILVDIGSANGTFVNGDRISEPRQLHDRDVIGLGSKTPTLQFAFCAPE